MQRIKIEFENCYGIRKLSHEFDTSKGQAFLVYAPNGAMKSSFARVFADVAGGKKPKDSIFVGRKTTFSIKDETDSAIQPERILVVEPYAENYTSQRTATLMADQGLRSQYEALIKLLEHKASTVLAALGTAAGLKNGVQEALAAAYPGGRGGLYGLLDRMYAEVDTGSHPGLDYVAYTEVFNDKVVAFLSKAAVHQHLQDYVERYNELVSKSTYFRPGVFNHNHAVNVRKALADNGFFAANHTLSLAARDTTKTEITSAKALDAAIEAEKKQILMDPELAKKFELIDKEITRNAELRQLRDYLETHQELIPHLADLQMLRRKLWLSYAFKESSALADFASNYREAQEAIEQLVAKAKQQETQWQRVLSIFHRRFSVPFSLEVVNQGDVMLKDQAPSLLFKYKDGLETCEIGRSELINALSTGEKRALYLLNVIFEIEARAAEPGQTVLVLDDIADSFDYKNKYAIVEYLKAILETGKFAMIILTHNFDFFRTIQGRLSINRGHNCLMATKSDQGVALVKAENLDPFKHWRKTLHKSRKLMLASIPLVRNLVEYKEGDQAADFLFLTSLLHKKPGSDTITMTDLAAVVNRVLGTTAPGGADKVIDVLLQEADSTTADGYTINLENKVILSIAIRLLAEDLMISKINDTAKTDNITSNQTRELFEIYKQEFPGDSSTIAILDRVMLMTPEAIHLNSFMYEPILDMTDGHLKSLHDELKHCLKPPSLAGVSSSTT